MKTALAALVLVVGIYGVASAQYRQHPENRRSPEVSIRADGRGGCFVCQMPSNTNKPEWPAGVKHHYIYVESFVFAPGANPQLVVSCRDPWEAYRVALKLSVIVQSQHNKLDAKRAKAAEKLLKEKEAGE